MKQNSVPFFMTQHSPVGAWASFTFGLPGKGASIDMETSVVKENADFMVGVSRGGSMKLLPFISGSGEIFKEGGLSSEAYKNSDSYWSYYSPEEIDRNLTGAVDEYSTTDMVLKVYTLHASIPNPDKYEITQFHCCPGILMEITVDNRNHREAANGFIGLKSLLTGRIRSVDDWKDGSLCGIAHGTNWAMTTKSEGADVFTIRNYDTKKSVVRGERIIHNAGNEGGICFAVKGGEIKTLAVAFGFFKDGCVTAGVAGRYYYTKYFKNVESVCEFILDKAESIKEECDRFDTLLEQRVKSPAKYSIIAQAIRAYEACAQLLETEKGICYSVSEGAYMWRNTLDLAVDHLPWELHRNPWLVRNIMDWFIDRYSFEDQVEYPDERGKLYPGGISFTHDMGSYSAFSKPGESMYERRNMTEIHCYFHMTTEELLNGICCISAYGIKTRDVQWLSKNRDILNKLIVSVENRDHHVHEKRDGMLKAKSERCGELSHESTTYDFPGLGLMNVTGNLYITVKTFASLLLLSEACNIIQDFELQKRVDNMLVKTSRALESFRLPEGYLRPNLYSEENMGKIIAALEPLALIGWLGLENKFFEYGVAAKLLKEHAYQCIGKDGCIDKETGGIRLNSESSYTWVSKCISCIYVLEKIFKIDMEKECSSVFRELLYWIQVAQAEVTISDQVLCSERKVIGGLYYPRSASSAFWI